MNLATFLQDLAVIMVVAGITTVLFHQLRQPVVLGYILAGMILSQHTPPFSFISDQKTVHTLADIGVIFLMFSLGLEFSIRRLSRVGVAALFAALSEIVFMTLAGYIAGYFFGWRPIDALFLGAMLAISSTTIIVKALHELDMHHEEFAQLIFGILIIEDILAIGMLALLSGIAGGSTVDFGHVIQTLGKLLVFLVTSIVIGLLVVPRLISYVASFKNKEMLLITVLGLCFGFSLLVLHLNYSVALGAFLIGTIMAETREHHLIEKLTRPLTDMFSAIFFVSIGLLVDPKVIWEHLYLIFIISMLVVIGKVVTCGLGIFLAGRDGKTAMRVGMGLAQIGEFSFIIASLGVTLKVTSPFLYPIIVAVSAITTLLTPWLIKFADPFSNWLAGKMPENIASTFNTYTTWLASIKPSEEKVVLMKAIKKSILQIFVNLTFVTGIFILGSYVAYKIKLQIPLYGLEKTIIWGSALILSLPFLIAIYRKIKALSMMIAELSVKPDMAGKYNITLRRVIAEMIPVLSLLGIMFVLMALSVSILPPVEWLVIVLLIAVLVAGMLWNWFVKMHARLQIALIENLEKKT